MGRRARVAMGRARRMRRKILGKQSVHYFKEKCPLADISAAANSTNFGTQVYKAADLTNWTAAYQNLFDLYKLLAVKITIFPRFNVSAAEYQNPAGNSGALPLLAIAPNRDPYVPAPTSWADIVNDDGVRIVRLDRPRSFYLSRPKPRIQLGDANIEMPVQYNVGVQPWLTTGGNSQVINQSGVTHYGHRWAIWNEGPYNASFHIVAEYSLAFKEQD